MKATIAAVVLIGTISAGWSLAGASVAFWMLSEQAVFGGLVLISSAVALMGHYGLTVLEEQQNRR